MGHVILIETLEEVLDAFDLVVLDQWGVLHNGSAPYSSACQAMEMLKARGKEICILSNSGKRADLNFQRIKKMRLPVETISRVVTSGEALWHDINESKLQVAGNHPCRLFPISGHPDDARIWAEGGGAEIEGTLSSSCDAVLLMGLPDDTDETDYEATLRNALDLALPMICSNPDKTSPRGGCFVMSPGFLADRYEGMGGEVIWYGKPHAPVFEAVRRHWPGLPPSRILMVGDSLEHDIAGGQNAGFQTALVLGGIHKGDFPDSAGNDEISGIVERLAERHGVHAPDYCLKLLA
jgi:HAD superfamily hydrolase (TIGR01459 family)